VERFRLYHCTRFWFARRRQRGQSWCLWLQAC